MVRKLTLLIWQFSQTDLYKQSSQNPSRHFVEINQLILNIYMEKQTFKNSKNNSEEQQSSANYTPRDQSSVNLQSSQQVVLDQRFRTKNTSWNAIWLVTKALQPTEWEGCLFIV